MEPSVAHLTDLVEDFRRDVLIDLQLAVVIALSRKQPHKFFLGLFDLDFGPSEDNHVSDLSHILILLGLRFLLVLWHLLGCMLVPDVSEFLCRVIKSENFALAVIRVSFVSLEPVRVRVSCCSAGAPDIIVETVSDSLLVSRNSLSHAKLTIFAANLVVRFNLPVLIWVVEDAVKVAEVSGVVICVAAVNLVRPPAFEVRNRIS